MTLPHANPISTVSAKYAHDGSSTKSNTMDMRPMQATL
jgi:hypothetical protein